MRTREAAATKPFGGIPPLARGLTEGEREVFAQFDATTLPPSLAILSTFTIEFQGGVDREVLDKVFAVLEGIATTMPAVAAAAVAAMADSEDGERMKNVLTASASQAADLGTALGDHGKVSGEPVALMIVQPPTRAELQKIAKDEVHKAFVALADDQLFGPGRRPFVTAYRGLAQPTRTRMTRA